MSCVKGECSSLKCEVPEYRISICRKDAGDIKDNTKDRRKPTFTDHTKGNVTIASKMYFQMAHCTNSLHNCTCTEYIHTVTPQGNVNTIRCKEDILIVRKCTLQWGSLQYLNRTKTVSVPVACVLCNTNTVDH